MKLFFRVFSYAKKLNVRAPQYVLFIFLSAGFSVVNFAMLIPLLNVLFEQKTAEVYENPGEVKLSVDYAIDYFNYYFTTVIDTHGKEGALIFVCVVLVVSVLMANVFRYLASITSAKVRLDVVKNMRMDIYSKVSVMHLGFFSNERKGDLMSRITNDVQEVENSVLNSPKSLIREPVQIIFYFIALFAISYKLTLFTILILPISGGVLGYIVKKLKKKAVESQESLGRIVNILDETLGGIRIVKAFNALNYVRGKMDDETTYYKNVNLSYSYRKEMGSPVSEFLGVGIVTVILYYGGSLVLSDSTELKASEFIAYLAFFSQIISPAKAFSQAFSTVPKGLVSAERIFNIIDIKPAIISKPNAEVLERFEKEVSFEQVDFAYDKDAKVLSDINFSIAKGKTVALVGSSGGGKSTLADLIPRFYDVTGGSIKIDGKDIRDYEVESVRKHMGIVTQESILFNDTIFNNIAFGIEGAKMDDVINAAKIANAHNFIKDMEEGYETNIGDRGMKLSGGQRQRISIARAVLKNPPILILDEATSALDSESERLVQEALSNLMQNRTSLVIAHRLSTIQHADEIIVIQQGKIIERGSHEELLSQEGMYKKLNVMQNT